MSLQDVLLEELRDLYSAENQLVKALPKMAKAASSSSLKEALTEHLAQTKEQVSRLRQIFEQLGKKPTGEHCKGMEGVIAEGAEALESDEEGAVKDVELIGASLRVEHYEIAGYTAAIAIAKALGHKEVVGVLSENLEEEKAAAKTLLAESKGVLKEAASEPEADAEEEEDDPKDDEEKESEEKSKKDEQEAKKSAGNRRS